MSQVRNEMNSSTAIYSPTFSFSFSRMKAARFRLEIIVCIILLCISFSTCQTLSSGSHVKDYVSDLIDNHEAVVFSKSYCPHCRATKELLTRYKERLKVNIQPLDVSIIELDILPNPNDAVMIQNYLFDLTNQRTVPNIFIGSRHIGGNSDIQAMDQNGRLESSMIGWILEQKRAREL